MGKENNIRKPAGASDCTRAGLCVRVSGGMIRAGMTRLLPTALLLCILQLLLPAGIPCQALAASLEQTAPLPGEGVVVRPVRMPIREELFQIYIVSAALADLGFLVREPREMPLEEAITAVAESQADFYADYWDPLFLPLYRKAGGESTLKTGGPLVSNAFQGYLIDRKTAQEQHITTLADLRSYRTARLFDADGNGRADLWGCDSGWMCATVINNHLQAYQLTAQVEHRQGNYFDNMEQVIRRIHNGQPVLFYAWMPLWVFDVLRVGEDVVWLPVPFTSLPGEPPEARTTLADGTNLGWSINTLRILSSRTFTQRNPSAARLFAVASIPAEDIAAENLKMYRGEDSDAAIRQHACDWIALHRPLYDGWLQSAGIPRSSSDPVTSCPATP